LQGNRDEARDHRRPQQDRPDLRHHAADRGPVNDERRFANEQRRGRGSVKCAGVFCLRPQRKADADEKDGRARIEPKKLHPRLALNPGEDEGDTNS
jgi:hypothetical protein